MEGNDREVIERLVWLFNHMLDPDADAYRAEVERTFAEEPEIVPMRAALEGNVYRGAGAAEAFRRDSQESWSVLEIEVDDVTGAGPRYLGTGVLTGRGRESGIEVRTQMWAVIDVEDGRVARVAAHLDRAQALAEMDEAA